MYRPFFQCLMLQLNCWLILCFSIGKFSQCNYIEDNNQQSWQYYKGSPTMSNYPRTFLIPGPLYHTTFCQSGNLCRSFEAKVVKCCKVLNKTANSITTACWCIVPKLSICPYLGCMSRTLGWLSVRVAQRYKTLQANTDLLEDYQWWIIKELIYLTLSAMV